MPLACGFQLERKRRAKTATTRTKKVAKNKLALPNFNGFNFTFDSLALSLGLQKLQLLQLATLQSQQVKHFNRQPILCALFSIEDFNARVFIGCKCSKAATNLTAGDAEKELFFVFVVVVCLFEFVFVLLLKLTKCAFVLFCFL